MILPRFEKTKSHSKGVCASARIAASISASEMPTARPWKTSPSRETSRYPQSAQKTDESATERTHKSPKIICEGFGRALVPRPKDRDQSDEHDDGKQFTDERRRRNSSPANFHRMDITSALRFVRNLEHHFPARVMRRGLLQRFRCFGERER